MDYNIKMLSIAKLEHGRRNRFCVRVSFLLRYKKRQSRGELAIQIFQLQLSAAGCIKERQIGTAARAYFRGILGYYIQYGSREL